LFIYFKIYFKAKIFLSFYCPEKDGIKRGLIEILGYFQAYLPDLQVPYLVLDGGFMDIKIISNSLKIKDFISLPNLSVIPI